MNPIGIDPMTRLTVYSGPDGRQWLNTQAGLVPYAAPQQQFTLTAPPPPQPGASAIMKPPDMAELVRDGFYRRPFYPTAPIYAPGAARITPYYSTGFAPGDTDYPAVSATVTRTARFDTACVLVAINGQAFPTQAGNAFPVGVGPRDCWRISVSYGQNAEKLTISQRLASTVVGTGERPGEIGGDGWIINPGNVLTIEFQPLIDDLAIDVTFVVLEQRGMSSFVNPAS